MSFAAWLMRCATRSAVLACVATACAVNPRDAVRPGPDPAAVSATLALDLHNPDSARETFFGDVLVIALPRYGVAVLLDGGPTPGMRDGYVDQAFVLQQETPSNLRTRTIEGAELHYAGRALFVRDPGGASLLLAVGESEINSVPASALAASTRYEGFGLARRTGAWTVPLARAPDALDEILPVALR